MDLTSAEKKVLERSKEVAKKYDEGNIDKIEQIDKKLRETPPQEREGLINDLKMFNRKRTMKSVSDSLNSIVSKYELKVSDPPTQTPRDPPKPTLEKPKSTPREKTALRGAGAGAGAEIKKDEKGRASLVSPREPLPPVKVKSVTPKPKPTETQTQQPAPSTQEPQVETEPPPAPPPPAPPPTPEPVKTQEEPKPAGKVESIDKPTDTLVVNLLMI
jgi:hypothetical protein